MFRRRPKTSDVPARPPIPDSCRAAVDRADRARAHYAGLVESTAEGPLRDRLTTFAAQLDDGIRALYRIAEQIATIERVTAILDIDLVTAELKQARREGASDEVVDALMQRFVSTQTLLNDHDALLERVEVLTTQLDTAISYAAQVIATSADDIGLAGLEQRLGDVVGQLDALAEATAEVSRRT